MHHDQGDTVCTNATGVPAAQMHAAVINSLHETFSAESFEAHLKATAADESARESRQAERGALLARLPVIATEEQRIADAIAGGADIPALVAKLKSLQTEREIAEARVLELEGVERNLRADQDAVERLRETWKTWSGALSADPASQEIARQILRKVLECPILVRPDCTTRGDRTWAFGGIGRYDGILSGGVSESATVVIRRSPKTKLEALRALLVAMGVDVNGAGPGGPDNGEGVPCAGQLGAPHLQRIRP